MTTDPPRLEMTNIRKRYGSTVALDGVDLQVERGEVHAIVGENGAGKSTLVKVLSGATAPDAGTMTLDGHAYTPAGPAQARRQGVAMVYQELTLAPHLSVEANITLGVESHRLGFLAGRKNRRRVTDVLDLLEHADIKPDSTVRLLSPAAQQLVEIARALLVDAKVLVLDEPTSALNQQDAQRLFAVVRRLSDKGVSVLFISHFLEEVEEIADRVTVLRDGQRVATARADQLTGKQMVELMVGRSLDEQFPRVPHERGEPVLSLSDLAGEKLPLGVSMTLHRGEIVGLAGVVGAGRTEMLRTIFGLDPLRRGEVTIKSVSARAAHPRARIRQGVGLLSEDRKEEGLSLNQSIADNLTYSRLSRYSLLGWLNLGRRAEAVRQWLVRLGVRHRDAGQHVGELSGGNQQKVAIGRLLHQEADILLLDEPTRGVDIGSKAEIYRLIGELAAQGKAILFVSSYLPELFGVCDRLAVMSRGKLSPIRSVDEWTPEKVMAFATESQVEG